MVKTDIFSGFLGAGKTTLIRKLISNGYRGEKLVLIENEFGEIAIDGGFLKDAGIQITEMNSGCICCTLVGDFKTALAKVIDDYSPDRIIIEPSGVGKLSDVAKAVKSIDGIELGTKVTVIDAGRCKLYKRNFGEFFNDQAENADLIVFSRTAFVPEKMIAKAVEICRDLNPTASIITTPWEKLSGEQILSAMRENGLKSQLNLLNEEHSQKTEEHEKHNHVHDEKCVCGCHEHEHDEECTCGCHDHEHGHHHADEIFSSWGTETARKFSEDELRKILSEFEDESLYGIVLRAKGYVDSSDGEWIYFDYVPGETDIRRGSPAVTGRFCVIGSGLNKEHLKELFNIGI